jgi:sugar O-acyltransferase (sialic acid O-acetyltransferase NeuD family)
MEEILLIGGGGHCKSVIDVIEQEGKFKIVGIIDKEELVGTKVLGYKIIGNDTDLPKLFENFKNAFICVGHIKNNETRIKLFNYLKEIGFNIPTIVSPLSYVSEHSHLEEGTVVMHDVTINANSTIGKNCIINTKALIEHDCTVKDNCHISTGAIINGGTTVNESCFIGSNSATKEYITIKENTFIKAGTLVV